MRSSPKNPNTNTICDLFSNEAKIKHQRKIEKFPVGVVVGEGAAVFELFPNEDESLLVRRDTCPILDHWLDVFYGVGFFVLLSNKIGAILSTACGTASIVRSRNMPFGFGVAAAAAAAADDQRKQFDDGGGALSKTHPCQRHPIAFASAVLTRKWKTSLRKVARVKLRLKMKSKTKTTANDEAMELCKKRILMGEKCRALNLSGVLHYDKQGILLPED